MIDGLVSVITPMYNAEQYIGETIASVRNQSYENWEMIIVDDCSTDQSANIVMELMKGDERIRYYKNDTNQGVASSRNAAIEQAQGRYLAFLDSDDIWERDKLKKQIGYMRQNDIAFCHSACRVIDEAGNDTGKVRYIPGQLDYQQLLKGNCIACLTVVIDREQTEIMRMPDIPHEDYATWLGILRTGKQAYGINEVLAGYRVSSESVSGNKIKAMKWTWNIYRDYLELGMIKSMYYFGHYVINAVRKRI